MKCWDCRYKTTTFAVCRTGDPTWDFVHLAKHLTSWPGVPASLCCKVERCVYAGKEEGVRLRKEQRHKEAGGGAGCKTFCERTHRIWELTTGWV